MAIGGISTDGDAVIGCDGPLAPNAGSASAQLDVMLSNAFVGALGDDAAFDDCYLSPDEIQSSAAAAAFARTFAQHVADEMGVPVSTVSIGGISTDGDTEIGCNGPVVPGGSSGSASTGTRTRFGFMRTKWVLRRGSRLGTPSGLTI